jgi:hypothetical protein
MRSLHQAVDTRPRAGLTSFEPRRRDGKVWAERSGATIRLIVVGSGFPRAASDQSTCAREARVS